MWEWDRVYNLAKEDEFELYLNRIDDIVKLKLTRPE